ncbi:hypothetical protein GGR56DRAFT_643760 [Xylariaceae sp. FL0804]|nr:hypothetical protein GGR56DRAFT_643760 [Xylariaceae sp. FL0804]
MPSEPTMASLSPQRAPPSSSHLLFFLLLLLLFISLSPYLPPPSSQGDGKATGSACTKKSQPRLSRALTSHTHTQNNGRTRLQPPTTAPRRHRRYVVRATDTVSAG